MSQVTERFLRYVQFDTRSEEEAPGSPSTPGQMVLANALAAELETLGLSEVSCDEHGYVYATLPANITQPAAAVGFVAHMDTSPEVSGAQIKPRLFENYDGKPLLLNETLNVVLSPEDFPDLLKYKGETLITTDGTTLLGADDKAGIAEIVTAAEYLIQHPELPHGTLCFAFTPDEEVGRGTDFFNLDKFPVDFAYTVDGGPLGELEFENFNAAKAKIVITGRNVHPGTAKGKMLNSLLLAAEFIALLPPDETPAQTEGYVGFYHLTGIRGEVEQTRLNYLIRDFDQVRFAQRKAVIENIARTLGKKYPQATFEVEIKDQYYNMKEKIAPVQHIVDTAFQAMQAAKITPVVNPVRGGTDGAALSYKGLPTPNLFTGGHNFHGRYEFIPVESMEKAVETLLKIVELYSRRD
ncbi:Peptidase M20 [Acididesulfobacillus acetoxydans]|uniref:Peptidase T n=1 Tax=Acididesulfobacillus acetoxydans TaxID=1561005 RepID=A0A8S0WWP2_9FIRM|nr:peptidase T [Acididesulfobacillus acetoxydans]CAA7600421.1 Peptidase M20 [Acididesulfobacillus acetoxydans]CEJ06555.1 Peptidase T [Acididesulfobacillus acetoxydans]